MTDFYGYSDYSDLLTAEQGRVQQVDAIIGDYRNDGETILDALRRLVDEYNVLFDAAVQAYDDSVITLGVVGVDFIDAATETDAQALSEGDSIIWGS